MTFFSRLESRSREADSLLCVGLDPHPSDLPEVNPQAALSFCLQIIEATQDFAAAYKPNSAFFEALGPEGLAVLQQVIAAVPDGIPVILDAKRGDIGSTAAAYADAAFRVLGADAITANPYLGYDALEPFLSDPEHGVFLLCKTSNPGSGDLQDLPVAIPRADKGSDESLTLYETVADLARRWNQKGNLGLVAGATHADALGKVRNKAPGLWILAPGVGAQGGDLQAALQAGLREDGLGMLIPVSRGISRASDMRDAAERLRAEINQARDTIRADRSGSQSEPGHLQERISLDGGGNQLADALLAAGCIKFGDYTLKSGLHSPIYIDLRELIGYPGLLSQVAAAYLPILRRLVFQRLAALPYAALPIGTAISLLGNWPLIYPRKEAKAYGTSAEIEGVYQASEQAVVIDDLATTGGSKFEAIEKLTQAGLQVKDVVVLVDRESGAGEALAQAGFQLHAVFTLTGMLDYWEGTGQVPLAQIEATRNFIRENR